jgi:immune inhibitor A
MYKLHHMTGLCRVAPSPKVLTAIRREMQVNKWTADDLLFRSAASTIGGGRPVHRVGFNDGVFYPEEYLPEGLGRIAAMRPSIRTHARKTTGNIHALVLLVDFSDNKGQRDPKEFEDLLFSLGTHQLGSMRDYYQEVSFGKLDVTGLVIGWLSMPHPYSYYVGQENGMSNGYPENSQGLAEDALRLASREVDLGQFDLDGDGFIDGLFIVHAGGGAEAALDPDQRRHMIWSHKHVLRQPLALSGVSAFAYSVEPEDGSMGVFAHEFGHVLGLPDLYDTTNRSSGAGMWCLMARGSWGDGGRRPAHLCAWAKAYLGWLRPKNVTTAQTLALPPVEERSVSYRIWKNGQSGLEFFLIENRQRLGSDSSLPGSGLLIWHIDERQRNNDDPLHYRVGLEQADGKRDLERGQNDGDAADPYPGSTNNPTFDDSSKPNSRDYFGDPTGIGIRQIKQRKTGELELKVGLE